MKRFLVFLGLFSVVSFGLLLSHDHTACYNQVIPEAIWAPATGGGTWVTSVQITSHTAATNINVYFYYGGGNFRYIPNFYTGLGANESIYYSNILYSVDMADPEAFTYYGRVGTLMFYTGDGSKSIQVTARTVNGDYGKTMQGLSYADCYKVANGGSAAVFNVASSATYRTFCGFFNWSDASITVRFYVVDHNFVQVGNNFVRTFAAWDFQSFNPFTEAGRPYPSYSYSSNYFIYVLPESGTGQLVGFGSSANNNTNDSAAHVMAKYY